jgi:hypothetical protein
MYSTSVRAVKDFSLPKSAKFILQQPSQEGICGLAGDETVMRNYAHKFLFAPRIAPKEFTTPLEPAAYARA